MKGGKIYFLRRHDGLIKIGFTTNFDRRLRDLTKSHGSLEVIRVLNGDKRREKRLHGTLSRHNEFGEWFRDTPELRKAIEAEPDGSTAHITEDDAKRCWVEGEEALVREARSIVERLIMARRQRTGCKNSPSIKALGADYGISPWLLTNIHAERASVITAYTLKVLKDALPVELLAHRDELLATVAAIEAGDDENALVAELEAAQGEGNRAR